MKKEYRVTSLLLLIGSLFFLFEFFLHFFGLPILEHDKIFLYTHDRYIALFGLTYAALLTLVATDLKKYRILFFVTMVGILLAMLNASYIAYSGGYTPLFEVVNLDSGLKYIGIFAYIWYPLAWLTFYLKK